MMIETFPVVPKGVGKPDYTGEVFRGKELLAHRLEESEELLWLIAICIDVPGPAVITRLPLAAGATLSAFDYTTGVTTKIIPAGWDYVIKEFWVSFDQDVEFIMFQGGTFNDVSCSGYFASGSKPVNLFQVGWTRSLLEDISVASTLRVDIRNLSLVATRGKVWVAGLLKEGAYTWF